MVLEAHPGDRVPYCKLIIIIQVRREIARGCPRPDSGCIADEQDEEKVGRMLLLLSFSRNSAISGQPILAPESRCRFTDMYRFLIQVRSTTYVLQSKLPEHCY